MARPTDVQLAELLAKQEIIEAIDDLFIATDRRDWAAVRSRLADTVRFDMSSAGGGEARDRPGRDIALDWERGLAPLHAIHHQAGNYRVRVRGDDADASCYGIAYHFLPKRSGNDTRVFVGSYDFELRREDARWRITRFRFNLKFISGNRELEKPD